MSTIHPETFYYYTILESKALPNFDKVSSFAWDLEIANFVLQTGQRQDEPQRNFKSQVQVSANSTTLSRTLTSTIYCQIWTKGDQDNAKHVKLWMSPWQPIHFYDEWGRPIPGKTCFANFVLQTGQRQDEPQRNFLRRSGTTQRRWKPNIPL